MQQSVTETVLVTGGADSVGRVIAEAFAAGGHKVHICDVNAEALSQTLAANPGMQGTLADVSDPAAVARVFAESRQWLGDVSVLVNNVGIGGPRGNIEDLDVAQWQRTLDVNVSGMLYCMQQAIPGMKAKRHGVILNFSTGSTRTRLPMRTAYVASKFAVEGLTLNAARELGPFNIRCNAILPGAINNLRMRKIISDRAAVLALPIDEVTRDVLKYISMKTMVEPSEIADMVLFLASGAAAKVTGELVSVSGNVEWEE
ncbi:NAD(P)-dependent dehydrogenase, short-chain alcohol dehydrogenase family [Polaromonas sp. OV174]|uniref:SDR family oxidoreductase n=1 Tax=Polaromonas sp. OV174 TaxID=1855300 RepID=UPI0008E28C18|nr:SDR family oxidoreductase [Polaromonas sp. OV174]SFB78428.1 NAD(P)-dependent dehydrogenase, short-chain alcohol dehydrogenase family [Polaromonas sp. OV174]